MKVFDFIKSKIKLNKQPKQRLLLKQFSLLCVTIVMLICVVFAWFTANNGVATASGIHISMTASDNMSISLNGTNFFSSIDILNDNMQQYISESNIIKGKLNMEDITSDGTLFLRPTFNEINGVRYPKVEDNWNPATPNKSYISQTITFQTSSACSIYMGAGTRVLTSCEADQKDLVNNTDPSAIGNKNAQYNFSNDCIVGALRISGVDSDGNLCFLCIPRSDIELVRTTNEETDAETVTMNTGDAVSNNAKKHFYYTANYQEEKAPVEASGVIYGFDGSQLIATTAFDEATNTYLATATINIWIEGEDDETTRILAGGKFNFNFDFIAVDNID